jgi:hypothetical protein
MAAPVRSRKAQASTILDYSATYAIDVSGRIDSPEGLGFAGGLANAGSQSSMRWQGDILHPDMAEFATLSPTMQHLSLRASRHTL